MHIVLGALGTIVTILVILYRLAEIGVDLGGLNPFLWRRRRAWRQKYSANPVFSLDDPKAIAGLLVVGVAKIDGDMSAQEKTAILEEFQNTFALDAKEASDLLGSSVYLLGDGAVLSSHLDEVCGKGRVSFTTAQAESLLALMERIASIDGAPTARQAGLVDGVRRRLGPAPEPQGTWG